MSNGETDPCSDEYEVIINEAIASPRRVSVDGVEAQTRSGSELISMLRYRETRCAANAGRRGFSACRREQLAPPNGLGIHLGWNRAGVRGS